MPTRRDLTGMKYSHLTLLHHVPKVGYKGHAIWMAKCDCGKLKEVVGRDVVFRAIKTCGDCEYSRKLRANANRNRKDAVVPSGLLIKRLKEQATHKDVPYTLEARWIESTMLEDCLFCGSACNTGGFSHSLLVSMEKSVGYTEENTVPCCRWCNRLKGDSEGAEFLGQVLKIADRIHETRK